MNWPFCFELLLRSAALLLAGVLLRRLCRQQSAAFRHGLLLAVFALLAMLPILSAFLPEIPFPLWHLAPNTRALVTVQEVSSSMLGTTHSHHLNWPLLIWLTGAFLAAAPIFIGSIAAQKIARRSTSLRETKLKRTVPATATPVLLSSELALPLTCGFFHPRILLPAAAEHWPVARLQAVLLHEQAHVSRRDVATQIAVHLIAALWWFQPLVWILRPILRSESELACDAEALRSGFRPSSYAAELLAIAKTLGRDYNFSSSAISMLRSRDLETRLRAILNPPLRHSRTYALAFALAPLAIAASALTFHSNQPFDQPGGSTMKRTFLSALLTSVTLSAATVGGSVYDSTGAPLSDVKVFVYNPDTGAKQETVTGADGKFSFSGNPAGQFILRGEKPGFTSLFREFDLKADSNIARDFTMTNEGAPPVADKVVATNEDQSRPIRIGGMVAQSNLLTKVQPTYPVDAKTARIQGRVEIETTISKDGVPTELRVLSSPGDDLSQSALEAVRQWRYRPTLLNGSPVEIITLIFVNYSLVQ